MNLPFQDRNEELARLRKRFTSRSATLVCLYGRRRCGKSRLLLAALEGLPAVYYVGDDREAVLQRRSLAKEIARIVEGFDRTEYPGWDDLLDRWLADAPAGAVLAIDELPFICGSSPEFPGLLQKFVDKAKGKPVHLALCGSSQRMMMGLTLNSAAPLYGRADEIIRVRPLQPKFLYRAGRFKSAAAAVEAWCVWGGIPRYWELALEYPDTATAIRELVLNPVGVLHQEPGRLLIDELRDTRQASSILSLVGQGCSRLSEIAGRIGKPATSLSRPLAALMEMDFIRRDVPFGSSPRDTKRTLYRINDPFFDFWFHFVEPNRSLLESSRFAVVEETIAAQWPVFVGMWWEEIARRAVVDLPIDGTEWLPGARWWGRSGDGEIDILALHTKSKNRLLAAEAKVSLKQADYARTTAQLEKKITYLPFAQDKKLTTALFVLNANQAGKDAAVVTAQDIVDLPNKP